MNPGLKDIEKQGHCAIGELNRKTPEENKTKWQKGTPIKWPNTWIKI